MADNMNGDDSGEEYDTVASFVEKHAEVKAEPPPLPQREMPKVKAAKPYEEESAVVKGHSGTWRNCTFVCAELLYCVA
jgi:hypothetical protein